MTRAFIHRPAVYACMYSIHFISFHCMSMNARDACIRSVTALSLSRQSINQSHHINHINNRSSPRGNPLPTRTQPLDVGRAMAARVPPLCPCVYPPPCVYPGYTHTPSTPPLDGPAPVDRDTSTGHARGVISHAGSRSPQKTKQQKKSPPLLLQKCTNKHTTGGGRRRIQPTRGSVRPYARTRVRDG